MLKLPGLLIANAELQETGVLPFGAHSGDQYAELDTDWQGPGGSSGEKANVIISQTFATESGAECHVSYWQHCRDGQCDLQFDWTGAAGPVATSAVGDVWTEQTFVRTGAGPSTTISFTGLGTPDSIGVMIDDVSVKCDPINPPPVPEFPTMALPAALIVGMLGAVLFIQRNKEN